MIGLSITQYLVHLIFPKSEEVFDFGNLVKKTSSSQSLYDLGLIYENERDYQNAINMYQLAADRGSVDAMCSLAQIYHFGHGVQKDHEKARELYQKAVSGGNSFAIVGLVALDRKK